MGQLEYDGIYPIAARYSNRHVAAPSLSILRIGNVASDQMPAVNDGGLARAA